MGTTSDRERSRHKGRARPDASARLVVFTDLDGTLLDHEDYRWEPAREALTELARKHVPLVFATSKTRAEIEAWRTRLSNRDPFISENGGALYVPEDSELGPLKGAVAVEGYLRVAFGEPYRRLRTGLARVSVQMGVSFRGFGDMDAEELARRTGLAGEDLERARRREYDEPFVPGRPLTDEELHRLDRAAGTLGLHVTRGGRFFHLTGRNSKGAAAQALLNAYATDGRAVSSIALGDGPNDLELLRVVDFPVVVARPNGSHAPELLAALPRARFTKGIGPTGFNEAVLEHLARLP
jgi:mannosyl-3-phosphoglycerate phosphatase